MPQVSINYIAIDPEYCAGKLRIAGTSAATRKSKVLIDQALKILSLVGYFHRAALDNLQQKLGS